MITTQRLYTSVYLPISVNHAGDLIKKKLIRSYPSPENALRFSNLYSRLLTQPVLNQKWAILYLLYQLSDSKDPTLPVRTGSHKSPDRPTKNGRKVTKGGQEAPREDGAFEEAFAPGGIPRLPGCQGGPKQRTELDQSSIETPAPQREGSTFKTSLLSDNYVEMNPPETTLLRDLPFTLQGLSSTSLSFSSLSSLKLPVTLPPPIISLLHSLAEPSLLYKGLEAFIHSSEPGLLGQSLRAAIGYELRTYLELVATLEGEIRQALLRINEKMPRGGIGQAGVTLKRMVVATREATMGLRFLSLIAEESKSERTVLIRLIQY